MTPSIEASLTPTKRSVLRDYARGVITETAAAELLGSGSPIVHHERLPGCGGYRLALTLRGRGIASMLAAEARS